MPVPVGEPGGGMANAIVGTLMLTALAALFAVPIGIVSGIYMSEYAGSRLAQLVRFAADTLERRAVDRHRRLRLRDCRAAVPAVLALAGGVALGVMMIPIIARTTEELLRLVPRHAARRGPGARRDARRARA